MHALPDPSRPSPPAPKRGALRDPIASAATAACPPVPPQPAPMCRNVPSSSALTCLNVPSDASANVPEPAKTCPDLPECAAAHEIAKTNPPSPGSASTAGVSGEPQRTTLNAAR